MKSKVTILGHPVHPMLVSFPVAFYTAALASYLTYQIKGDILCKRKSFLSQEQTGKLVTV